MRLEKGAHAGKTVTFHFLTIILVLSLAGCALLNAGIQPTQVRQSPSPTVIPPSPTLIPTSLPTGTLVNTAIAPTPTLIPSATPTVTPTRLDTLEPTKVAETISALLRDPGDCLAPCFWGIMPGQTTVDKAEEIFNHLGLPMGITTFEGKEFATTEYDFGDGLSFDVILTLQNNVVENLRIKMNVEKQMVGKARKWLAYSPETLIKRYGMPSRVDFLGSWSPGPYFSMEMYFDPLDLIVEYDDLVLLPEQGSWLVCPLTTQFEGLSLWMGKNPVYPPGEGIQLEKATSLTIEDFAKLMTGNPKQACFVFNGNVVQ